MSAMQKSYGLVVGIANYQNVNPLPTTVLKDAQDVYNLFVDAQQGGYARDNVRLLLDGQATNQALREVMAWLALQCDSDSTVFIYVSSHGGRVEMNAQAVEFLLPVDVRYDSLQALQQSAISGDEFTRLLNDIPARKKLVLLDCCHSAGIGQPKALTAPQIKAGLPESYYEKLAAGRGCAILASSRESEYSYVLPGAANSLFTQHLLAGLCGGIPSEDGLIRVFNVFEYLQPRVTSDQPHQHPVFSSRIEENFPVSLRLGGQKSAESKDEQGFLYDAYISYADKGADRQFLWENLVPRLEQAGLRVAVSGDVDNPGVARVVNVERGIRQSKRTVILLSPNYLLDNIADFENTLAQTMGIQEGTYRLLPVRIAPIAENQLPTRMSMLSTLDVAISSRAEREYARLVNALQGPLPRLQSGRV